MYKNRQCWKCCDCKKKFRQHKRCSVQRLWASYAHDKQTYGEIGATMGRGKKWVQRPLDRAVIRPRLLTVGDVVVVMDTTYCGTAFGVMVFRCPHRRKNLRWVFMDYETIGEYMTGIDELRRQK